MGSARVTQAIKVNGFGGRFGLAWFGLARACSLFSLSAHAHAHFLRSASSAAGRTRRSAVLSEMTVITETRHKPTDGVSNASKIYALKVFVKQARPPLLTTPCRAVSCRLFATP